MRSHSGLMRQCCQKHLLVVSIALLLGSCGQSEDSAELAKRVHCEPVTPQMVFIGGGTIPPNTQPVLREEFSDQTVSVSSFWISNTEVTNAQFAKFVEETGYVTVAERKPDKNQFPEIPESLLIPGAAVFSKPSDAVFIGDLANWWQFVEGADWQHPKGPDSNIQGLENHPVIHIAYEDAKAYAEWKGHRLPTSSEFEFAAASGLTRVTERYSDPTKANTWQGQFPYENLKEDGYEGSAPVGCYPANSFGLYDMIGNVWEWSRDDSDLNKTNRHGSAKTAVIKGGSFLCSNTYCGRYRPEARQSHEKDLGTNHIGFRTAADRL